MRYWFRKVPGTSGRYVPTDWRGNAAIVVAVATPLALTFGAAAIAPWLAFLVGPVAVIVALSCLFTIAAKRVEP